MDISAEWLASRLQRDVTTVKVEDMSAAGGMSCLMVRLHLSFGDGSSSSMVYKRVREAPVRAGALETCFDARCFDRLTPSIGTERDVGPRPAQVGAVACRDGGHGMSGDLGLAREACFYQELAESTALAGVLPKIFFAQGDLTTGEKHIIMEDLRGVQSGYFFGPYSPLNWGKDLEKATEGFPLSALQVAKLAARQAAKLHGSFWKRRPSEDCAWLRGQKWVEGGDRELWEAYQARCRSAWDRVDFGASQWDPLLRQCMETAIAQAKPENRGFEQFLAWLRAAPWSLVHGDFHPANFMLTEGPEGAERFKLVLLDWENVGIGSGPQEIAQFLISHMQPEARALVEKEILQEYYDALLACNPAVAADMSWELCWQEYVLGGAGKWAWFLPILATICDAKMTQYFHDQLLAFLVTHGITPDSMPMVRA